MESKKKISEEYIRRINKVIDFIEKNLDQELSLDILSEKAFFSPYHFHRIFTAAISETPNSFIVRKRIERIASVLVVGTEESLNDLTIRYGFSNGNSFSRSFKKFYGMNPTVFRENFSKIGVEVLTYEKYICSINNIKNKKDEYIN